MTDDLISLAVMNSALDDLFYDPQTDDQHPGDMRLADWNGMATLDDMRRWITDCMARALPAAQVQAEPVAWWVDGYGSTDVKKFAEYSERAGKSVTPLYVHPAPPAPVDLIDAQAVAEAVAAGEGVGVWRSCTGCHESNEGHPTGPYSPALKCSLGFGCHECGGIGAIWDTTDYADMGDWRAGTTHGPPPAPRLPPDLTAPQPKTSTTK
jgi:hypothetical protein